MEFRKQWLNYILRKSSELFYLKQRLVLVHGLAGFSLLLRVWLQEIILSITAFPTFLFLKSTEVPREHRAVYQTRQRVTLIILIPLAVVWLLRLGVGMATLVERTVEEFTAGPEQKLSSATIWQKVSGATLFTRWPTPLISTSSIFGNIYGSAAPSSSVIVVLEELSGTTPVHFLKTTARDTGDWKISATDVKENSPGTYRVSAFQYDERIEGKSRASQSILVEIPSSWKLKISALTDYFIYGTIGMLLMLALIMSLLSV